MLMLSQHMLTFDRHTYTRGVLFAGMLVSLAEEVLH